MAGDSEPSSRPSVPTVGAGRRRHTLRAVLLPVVRAAWVRPILLANLLGEIGIVVTGGIVRLTGSGLGCPTWPECTEGSLIPVAGQVEGFHKWIEFGNRTLTGVVGLLALLALWAVWTSLPRRRALHWLAWGLVLGVVAQALVGGITVRTGLHPVTVAFHFLASMVLIALATALLLGAEDAAGGHRRPLVPRLVVRLGWLTAAVGMVVLVLGTIVTGSGPHSGDAVTPARTGFDPRVVSWLHADAVMLFCGLVIAMLVAVHVTDGGSHARSTWRAVLAVTLVQGAIGYVQYFTGLPEVLVAAHMLGAALLTVAVTAGVVRLYDNPLSPAPPKSPDEAGGLPVTGRRTGSYDDALSAATENVR